MKQTWFLFLILNLILTSWGRPKFLAIPLNNVQLVELFERHKMNQVSSARLPRHVSISTPQKSVEYSRNPPHAQASSHYSQINFNPHEYVDYGAHTGHHGSFGWYADFPAQKD
ncbi:hypothetical protein PGB90_008332 [Kerria lacca]